MDPVAQSHEFSGGNQHADRNSTLHPSTTNSSSVLRDDDTISLVSTSSVQAEDALGPVSSDINTSPEIAGGVRFRNSIAQSDAYTAQLNHESESQRPSEETLMMSGHGSSADSNSQKRRWKYKIKKAARGWWLWEIGGAALSIGCMIAILIIIPYLHNQPLKNWRFMVAPNTMISTLITVSKTSMLLSVAAGMGQLKWQHFHRHTRPISELDIYDEASRGPWGALVFILISPSRWRDTIAILGAFIMLSSLTMEPLAQQLLSFQTRYVDQDSGIAWISTATTWMPTLSELDKFLSTGIRPDSVIESLDIRAQYLILQGLWGSPLPLPYTCSSSNCSWSDFPSLGICSSYANVTSNFTVKDIPARDYYTFHGANYTTSRGITLPVSVSKITTAIPAIAMSGDITREGINKLSDMAFVAIANASGPPKFDHSISEYKYRKPEITECRISWCARFYSNLEMTNGSLNQYTVEEKAFSSEEYSAEKEFGSEAAYLCSTGYGNVTFRAIRGHTSYQFDLRCINARIVLQYFQDLFQFKVYENEASLSSGQLIINTESVPVAMDAITNAFSTYMMTSTPNITRHYGEAFSPEVFVIIRWQWLVFPGFLTILGAFFLGTSLWKCRAHRTSFLWKDSLVPLLFHGLTGWEKDEIYVNNKMDMDERAKLMKARLKMDDNGSLKFIRA